MAHSKGVILNNRAQGIGRWRDEIIGDGGKKKMHRRVRRIEKAAWQAEAAYEEDQELAYWENILEDFFLDC